MTKSFRVYSTAAARCTPSRATWRPTCDVTPVKNRSSVTGKIVGGGSQDLTSLQDTKDRIVESNLTGINVDCCVFWLANWCFTCRVLAEIFLWHFQIFFRQNKGNKTGLQPGSRPVEQILGCFERNKTEQLSTNHKIDCWSNENIFWANWKLPNPQLVDNCTAGTIP